MALTSAAFSTVARSVSLLLQNVWASVHFKAVLKKKYRRVWAAAPTRAPTREVNQENISDKAEHRRLLWGLFGPYFSLLPYMYRAFHSTWPEQPYQVSVCVRTYSKEHKWTKLSTTCELNYYNTATEAFSHVGKGRNICIHMIRKHFKLHQPVRTKTTSP